MEYGLNYYVDYQSTADSRSYTNSTPQCPNSAAKDIEKIRMVFPDGSRHEFVPYGNYGVTITSTITIST